MPLGIKMQKHNKELQQQNNETIEEKAKKQKKVKKAEENESSENTGSSTKKKKLKQIESTQIFSPIRDIKDGIVLTKDGRFVKIMEFSPINFGLRSNSEQDAIISQFAGVLRSMPATVQFKIITVKSDTDKFVKKIESYAKNEPVEGCRKLQADQINLIQSVSAVQGVARRFLYRLNTKKLVDFNAALRSSKSKFQ